MEENQTPKPKKTLNLIRWFALGLGGAIGISYIGVADATTSVLNAVSYTHLTLPTSDLV